MTEENDYLHTAEAARRLGVSTRNLYHLIDRGELPAYKCGRQIVILRRDVEKLLGGDSDQP